MGETVTVEAVNYRALSFWLETCGTSLIPRPALTRDLEVDVAIVGAGYTGLWSAYYLLKADPSLRVAIVESQIAGFGASGRNGGWCSALFPVSASTLAREHGFSAARAMYAAMAHSVDEVERVVGAEGIDAQLARGGTIMLARHSAQLRRVERELRAARRLGITLEYLDTAAAWELLRATNVLGATYTPYCLALHPARLVRGLADRVENLGGQLFERSPARKIRPHEVVTDQGTLRAQFVVQATEGFTATLPHQRRRYAPVYSLVLATAPIPRWIWEEIGLAHRQTFSDHRHLIVYGQRTADDRLVFGGRGAPYHFGSRIKPEFDRDSAVFGALQAELVSLFPRLANVPITHQWGGPLGVARDWHPSVGLEGKTGLAWAGGYVGDGVSTSNLAGRTLRDLILGRSSDLTVLPWVGHRSPLWPVEPLRYLGANVALRTMEQADEAEKRGGSPSWMTGAVNRVLGR